MTYTRNIEFIFTNDDGLDLASYGLKVTAVDVAPPTFVERFVEIPAAVGFIDLSTALTGYRQYRDREITVTAYHFGNNFENDLRRLTNDLHGEYAEQIIFDNAPTKHYKGRVQIDGIIKDGQAHGVTLKCHCQPYRYDNEATTVTKTLPTTTYGAAVSLFFSVPTVVQISNTADLYYKINGGTARFLRAGESDLLVLPFETTELTFNGVAAGSVTLSYEGAEL